MIVDPDWLLWPMLFTAELCDSLIAEAQAVPDMAGDMSWKGIKTLPEVRSSRLRWLYRGNPLFASAFMAADRAMSVARQHFGVTTDQFTAFQFTEYHAERRGHYDWHRDDFPEQGHIYDRRLSLCIQLSDPNSYGGGRLELKVANPPPLVLIGQRGAAIVFRSSTQHRVSPTVSGTRYSAVAWELGPG